MEVVSKLLLLAKARSIYDGLRLKFGEINSLFLPEIRNLGVEEREKGCVWGGGGGDTCIFDVVECGVSLVM